MFCFRFCCDKLKKIFCCENARFRPAVAGKVNLEIRPHIPFIILLQPKSFVFKLSLATGVLVGAAAGRTSNLAQSCCTASTVPENICFNFRSIGSYPLAFLIRLKRGKLRQAVNFKLDRNGP